MDKKIIDFHSHILPCVDHGSSSLEESLRQLNLMSGFGTSLAVATPHFYPHAHTVESFIKKRNTAICSLAQSKQKIDLCLGAEVLLCKNLDKLEELDRLCIEGTKILLIELPLRTLDAEYLDTAEALIEGGYTVILAHIDRYLKKYSDSVIALTDMGALAQINAEALHHAHMRKRIFEILRKSECICALGSDLHNVDTSLYKKFANAEKYLGGYYQEIMSRSQFLLKNAVIY